MIPIWKKKKEKRKKKILEGEANLYFTSTKLKFMNFISEAIDVLLGGNNGNNIS